MKVNFFNDIIQLIYNIFYINHQVIEEVTFTRLNVIDLIKLLLLRSYYIINNILTIFQLNEGYGENQILVINMYNLEFEYNLTDFMYFQNNIVEVIFFLHYVNLFVFLENNLDNHIKIYRYGLVTITGIAVKKTVEELVNYCRINYLYIKFL